MEQKELPETLAAHADQLNGDMDELSEMPPKERQELTGMIELAQRVKVALAPAKPSSAYRRKLRLELLEVAQQRMRQDVRMAPSAPSRELFIGAAIGSAMALAGGIVYLVRNHLQTRSQHAGPLRD